MRPLIHRMKVLTAFLFISSIASHAQEVVFPLNVNHAIISGNSSSQPVARRSHAFVDTLTLPFIDDFSGQGIYPNDSLWLDSNVFINSNYTMRPVTIGVATFDGLNSDGRPYDPSGMTSDDADYLTSRPIDMAAVVNDGSVWLSFFYQPQGLGDEPETGDSLMLEFLNVSGDWDKVWSEAGRSDTAFQRVNINIVDNAYFYRGFQFRFHNIATINGNRDHWHIDYVILNRFTAPNDSIRDNAMLRPQASLLTEYTAMPYNHYKTIGAAAMKTSVNDTIYDINYGPTSYTPGMIILQNGNPVFTNNIGTISSSSSNTYNPYPLPLNGFAYPVQAGDSVDFLVKSFFTQTGVQANLTNDTSYFHQRFHNYYAYDDGSAESAYGVVGNADVWMAYRFNVKMTDTLRGVSIYFNPVGVDVSNRLFQLAVWSYVDVASNSEQLLYKMINQKPDTTDSINGFKHFYFDSLIVLGTGDYYVGIIQNDANVLYGVGLDRNTDSKQHMFYHFDGAWYQSAIDGSWMIRPFFGDTVTVISVPEMAMAETGFTLYPNPAEDFVTVQFEDPPSGKYTFEIMNTLGVICREGVMEKDHRLRLDNLSAGVYFVRLRNERTNASGIRRLIVH